jgi:hypothetical protein
MNLPPNVMREMQMMQESDPEMFAMMSGMMSGFPPSGETKTVSTATKDVNVAKPPSSKRTTKMGWEIQHIELKKQHKKNKKKKNRSSSNSNKVSERIWISTSAPYVRDTEPMKRGIRQRQQTPEGRILDVHTTTPNTHQCPNDPIFAIEFPGAKRLGKPVDFLSYGNYVQNQNNNENNNNLSFTLKLKVPDDACTSKIGIKERADHFNNVSSDWILEPGHVPSEQQWIGGSTKYNVEIFCNVSKKVQYYTGKHTAVVNPNPHGEPEHHHGMQLQEGCIYQQRPTTILVFGDQATATNQDSLASIAVSISWNLKASGDFITMKSFRKQPDGRIWKDKHFQKEMNNQNLYMRAFLCAADIQDTGCLPGLCSMGKKAAYATGRLVEYADAVDRLTVIAVNKYYSDGDGDGDACSSCPGFDHHPYPETAFAYYAYCAGEAHEAAASLVSKVSKEQMFHQLKLAIASYKFGCYITSQCGAETRANYQIRCHLWQCLGLALRRYAGMKMVDNGTEHEVYFDMAERAYCWGLSCIFPYEKDTERKRSYEFIHQSLQRNLGGLLDFRKKSAALNNDACEKGMAEQRKSIKKKAVKSGTMTDLFSGSVIKGHSQCAECGVTKCADGSRLKRCSGRSFVLLSFVFCFVFCCTCRQI